MGGSPPASPASHLAGLLRRRDPSTNPGPIAWWVSVGNWRDVWAEVCRWITSLAGGSSCWGPNRWSHEARDINHPLRHKRQRKWCAARQSPLLTHVLSVPDRPSVDLQWWDVVSVYEQARQTRPNSGGVAEGHPRFDKGGVAIILYFLRVKNVIF